MINLSGRSGCVVAEIGSISACDHMKSLSSNSNCSRFMQSLIMVFVSGNNVSEYAARDVLGPVQRGRRTAPKVPYY